MKSRRSMPLLATLLLLAVPASLRGAELDPAHLPAEAKWVLHVDFEALSKTAFAEQLRENRPQLTELIRSWFVDRYGIDPRQDLKGATMFSETYEAHSGTLILLADYDHEKVKSQLENKSGVKTSQWEDHTLYTITIEKSMHAKAHRDGAKQGAKKEAKQGAKKEAKQGAKKEANKGANDAGQGADSAAQGAADASRGNERAKGLKGRSRDGRQGRQPTVTFVLLDEGKVVAASSEQRAQQAVKLLAGDAPSLEGKSSPLTEQAPEGAFVYGAAVELQQIGEPGGVFPVLRQHKQIVWAVGHEDGEVFKQATLVAASPEVAEQMAKVMEGLVAFHVLWAGDSEPLRQLAENTKVTLEGDTVQVEGRGDRQTVLQGLQEVVERFQQRRQAMRR